MIHIWNEWYFEANKDDQKEKFFLLYANVGTKEIQHFDFEKSFNSLEKMLDYIVQSEIYGLVRDLEENGVEDFFDMLPQIKKTKDFMHIEFLKMYKDVSY